MKKLVLFGVVLVIAVSCYTTAVCQGHVERPFILEPRGEVVDLTGKDTLLFKWMVPMTHFFGRDYFSVRVYKGYKTTAGNVIFKEQVQRRTNYINIDANLFENGEVYTCTVRHTIGIEKSFWAYRSFKVAK